MFLATLVLFPDFLLEIVYEEDFSYLEWEAATTPSASDLYTERSSQYQLASFKKNFACVSAVVTQEEAIHRPQ